MGTWKLEVLKMGMYMFFPVTLFHYFNQPEYFEEWVKKKRREMYPLDNSKDTIEFRQAIENIRKEQELKMLQDWEQNK